MAETASKYAPWHLVSANNKAFGRIAAFRILVDRLGKDVSLEPRPIDPELLQYARQALALSDADVARASDPAIGKER